MARNSDNIDSDNSNNNTNPLHAANPAPSRTAAAAAAVGGHNDGDDSDEESSFPPHAASAKQHRHQSSSTVQEFGPQDSQHRQQHERGEQNDSAARFEAPRPPPPEADSALVQDEEEEDEDVDLAAHDGAVPRLTAEQELAVIEFMSTALVPSSEVALNFLMARDFDVEDATSLYYEWQNSHREASIAFGGNAPFHQLLSDPLFVLPGTRDVSGSLLLIVNMRYWRPAWSANVRTGALAVVAPAGAPSKQSPQQRHGRSRSPSPSFANLRSRTSAWTDAIDTLAGIYWCLAYMVERALEAFPAVARYHGLVLVSDVASTPA
ncbi:hypothetical protein DFJ73DRAFT_264043 [Zopfochytrium polystomum]|nr:hypothetical protein DFJ73DRAFT_264043 [Zopfochytrium polystomum]